MATAMRMDGKRLEAILESGEIESRTLEFKRESPVQKVRQINRNGGAPKAAEIAAVRHKFVAAAVSFANTAGGNLIVGIEEEPSSGHDGPRYEWVGLDEFDEDGDEKELQRWFRKYSEPPLDVVCSVVEASDSDRRALICRVARSWTGPHRVCVPDHKFKGSGFYRRSTKERYEMEYDELREAFLASDSLIERLQTWTERRLEAIADNLMEPRIMASGPLLTLHAIPIDSRESVARIDPRRFAEGNPSLDPFGPRELRTGAHSTTQYLFEGFRHLYLPNSRNEGAAAYTLGFRSGAIEAVVADTYSNELVSLEWFHKRAVDMLPAWRRSLFELGLDAPLAVRATVIGGRGRTVPPPLGVEHNAKGKLDRKVIASPMIVIDDDDPESVVESLSPAFDALWNAAGYPGWTPSMTTRRR